MNYAESALNLANKLNVLGQVGQINWQMMEKVD